MSAKRTVAFVAGAFVAGGVIAGFVQGPEAEMGPIPPLGCGDTKTIGVDAAHDPTAIQVDYRNKDRYGHTSSTVLHALVRIDLTDRGVQLAWAGKATQSQLIDPAHAKLANSKTIVSEAGDEHYPANPDAGLLLVGKDVAASVDLSRTGEGITLASLAIHCSGNVS